MNAMRCCAIVELRQYTLHPGQRETLIALFDRELVETQEAVGMRVIAQFRDIDRPNVFTWLRGFPDMPSRAASLEAFYGGPVWAQHKDEANPTMVSFDNVRLLRPVRPTSGFAIGGRRPERGATTVSPALIVLTIYTLASDPADGWAGLFERVALPHLIASGAHPIALLETESSANTFPRLPVREGEHAFVWFASFAGVREYEQHRAALAADGTWVAEVRPALERHFVAPPEIWRLIPTARSRSFDTDARVP